jgi:hypothetical protein
LNCLEIRQFAAQNTSKWGEFMEIVKDSVKERFEKASLAMSKHCHDAGRLGYAIQLRGEELEKQKLELRNMRVDFDKLNKEFTKASEAYFAAKNQGKENEVEPSLVEQ